MNVRQKHKLSDAEAALHAGRPAEALALATTVLRDHPDDLLARLLEARARLALGQPSATLAALDALQRYQQTGPDRPDVALLRLEALRQSGSLQLTLGLADRLCEQFPDDPRPHRVAAEVALQLTRRERAIAALRQVVRLCPSDPRARRDLADLIESTSPDEAIGLLRQDPEAGHPARLARLLMAAGRWGEAREMYRQAMRIHPEDAAVRREAGRLADALGDDAAAVARLTEARAWTALGEAHLHAGRLAAAGRAFWRALREDGTCVPSWVGLKFCAIECGRLRLADRAAAWLRHHASREQRQRAFGEMWPHVAQGLALRQARAGGRASHHEVPSPLRTLLRQAAATMHRQVRQHPRRADMHYHLAVCQNALDRPGEAEASVHRALQLNPQYAAASKLALQLGAMRQAA